MWQLWLFIAPGLYRQEKRLALPFVLSSSLLFVTGAAFNHYVVFPSAFTFLGSFTTDYMEFMPRIAPVFSLYAQLLLAFGLIFQMPVLVFTLARLGHRDGGLHVEEHEVRDPAHLHHLGGRSRRRADAVTQTLMAAPMIVLYAVSIVIAWAFGKKHGQPSRWTDRRGPARHFGHAELRSALREAEFGSLAEFRLSILHFRARTSEFRTPNSIVEHDRLRALPES